MFKNVSNTEGIFNQIKQEDSKNSLKIIYN